MGSFQRVSNRGVTWLDLQFRKTFHEPPLLTPAKEETSPQEADKRTCWWQLCAIHQFSDCLQDNSEVKVSSLGPNSLWETRDASLSWSITLIWSVCARPTIYVWKGQQNTQTLKIHQKQGIRTDSFTFWISFHPKERRKSGCFKIID